MRRRRTSLARRAFAIAPYLLLGASLVLFAASVAARPGGGQSFGGSSRGGSSSGGDACVGAIVELLIELVFRLLFDLTVEHPAIGIPIDLAIVALFWLAVRQKGDTKAAWSTGSDAAPTIAAEEATLAARPSRAVRADLNVTVARIDPSFSIVLFEDFVYALYGAAQEARGSQRIAALAPYLSPAAREELVDVEVQAVKTPVIGALRYIDLSGYGAAEPIRVTVEIEANYTEVNAHGEHGFYVVDRWTLSRAPTARSREPKKASIIGCPNCGAPLSDVRDNTCSFCKQRVDTGAFDWMVESIATQERMERPPQLTSDGGDTGTELPTVVDPDAAVRLRAIGLRDTAFQWPRFLARVAHIFTEIQPAWSTLDWKVARPFVSDQLFQMLGYWIDSYKKAGLRNITKNARITGIELASVISDKYYDAITVRIHAIGLDYTIADADGSVVSGDKSRERAYTEYWTLIRGNGVATKSGSDKECPNCGAPLAINMAGSCTHCHAKVTSGEFDWVLSRIEQDAAYTG